MAEFNDAMMQSATEQAHEAGGEMRIGNCTGLHTDLTSDFLKLNLFTKASSSELS